jgi:hypothetical protein
VERRLRRRSMEVRPVQLGRQASRQRQGSPQARKGQVRQLKVWGRHQRPVLKTKLFSGSLT